jgi:excinuclease ABC subunit C
MSSVIENLKSKVSAFPTKPGVYLMKNFDGEIIYIGKAKDLKARVRSYVSTSSGDGRFQIKYLMEKVSTIDYVLTAHEEEALLLERELINKYKPRYNIRLKDDKAYISIKIDRSHKYPKIETVRRIIPDGSEYFGPFPSTNQIREILEVIKRVVPLRSCPDAVFSNRMRPCLEYEIKRCAAPCCFDVQPEQYQLWLKQAVDIIEGKLEPTLKSMEQQMNLASQDLRFEEAAAIRDRIHILEKFRDRGSDSIAYNFTCDVFSIYREDQLAIVGLLRTREGRMNEVESFSFRDVIISDEELLESVIQQYYEIGHDLPTQVVLSKPLPNSSLLTEFFTNKFNSSPEIEVPDSGAKLRLVRICEINARQAFQNKFFSETRFDGLSNELVEKFKLRQAPRRIECVDISNLQGTDIVGALVSFVDGVPDRKRYRRYNISFSGQPNDFEAIYEVVSRRLKHKESLPDLLIIDGGKLQLARALQARDEQGVMLDIVSLAKIKEQKSKVTGKSVIKPERIFIEGETNPVDLSEDDPVTHLLQRIRDEVHRYVITFHRERRKSRVFKSVLDQIPGIGPERKQRLLNEFGSIDKIKTASIEDLARVGRMSPLLAQKLIEALG